MAIALSLMTGCGGFPAVSPSTTMKSVKQAGTAVVLFSMEAIRPDGAAGCEKELSITFVRREPNGKGRHTKVYFGGRYFGIPRAHQELVLEPGDYDLAKLICHIPGYGASMDTAPIKQTIHGPEGRAVGKLSVSAGEVIDIGKLYIIAVNTNFDARIGSEYYTEALPNSPEILAKFKEDHPDLAAALRTRLITTPSPLPREKKRALCEQQKVHLAGKKTLYGPPFEAEVCKLLAQEQPARQNTTSSIGPIQ